MGFPYTDEAEPLCGVVGHIHGSWEDDELGIWWCPDCGDELWLNYPTIDDKASDD